MFWGSRAEAWAAIEAVGQAIITVIVAGIALYEIIFTRQENGVGGGWTYYLDPLLDGALRRLKDAQDDGSFAYRPSEFRIDVMTVLNYLDGIAVGISQTLYIDDLARDHLHAILKHHVDDYLRNGVALRTRPSA